MEGQDEQAFQDGRGTAASLPDEEGHRPRGTVIPGGRSHWDSKEITPDIVLLLDKTTRGGAEDGQEEKETVPAGERGPRRPERDGRPLEEDVFELSETYGQQQCNAKIVGSAPDLLSLGQHLLL